MKWLISASETITHVLPFGIEDIESAYVGKPDRCMCGCSGTYYYRKDSQEYAGKDRGYEVTDDEVNDAKVLNIYNKMKDNASEIEVKVIGGYIYTMVIGQTQYTIYLMKDKSKKSSEAKKEVFEFPYEIGDKVNIIDGETEKPLGTGTVESFLGWGMDPQGSYEQTVGVLRDDGTRVSYLWYELEKIK